MKREHLKYVVDNFRLNDIPKYTTYGCELFIEQGRSKWEIIECKDLILVGLGHSMKKSWTITAHNAPFDLFMGLTENQAKQILEELQTTEILFF